MQQENLIISLFSFEHNLWNIIDRSFLKELYINVRNPLVSRGMILLFVFLHLET